VGTFFRVKNRRGGPVFIEAKRGNTMGRIRTIAWVKANPPCKRVRKGSAMGGEDTVKASLVGCGLLSLFLPLRHSHSSKKFLLIFYLWRSLLLLLSISFWDWYLFSRVASP